MPDNGYGCGISFSLLTAGYAFMTVEQFETWSLYICVSALILFMFFIVWDLAKKSKAGKLGTFVLFGVLGLALIVFVGKEIAVHVIEG
ncbi:conserved hypothetical protein [Cellvibrio japonicus Ueda107]|uniref:DUF2788 domain-containing protein n=2 Tax=Cellvibrio japonicus TaxID=155077 RepID=B3PF06_CELJU|nr:conserved hypothetical protein [Cellvibrio japonicus Ueda107]